MTARIEGKLVEVGTLIGHGAEFARVRRLTKTQAVAHRVSEDDLATDALSWAKKPQVVRVKLDGKNGYPRGGREVGSSAWTSWSIVTDDEARERIANAKVAAADKAVKDAQEKARRDAVHAEDVAAVREAWEKREVVDETLGLFKVVFPNRQGIRLVIIYRAEERDTWTDGIEVNIQATVWSEKYGGGGGSGSRRGKTELDAVAELRSW